MNDDFKIQMKDTTTTTVKSTQSNNGSILNRFSPQKPSKLLLKRFNKSNSMAVLLFNHDNTNNNINISNNNNILIESQSGKIQKELTTNESIALANDSMPRLKLFKKPNNKKDESMRYKGSSSLPSSPLKEYSYKSGGTEMKETSSLPKFDKNPTGIPSINNIPFTNAEILACFQSTNQARDPTKSSPICSSINDYSHNHGNSNSNTRLLSTLSSSSSLYQRVISGSGSHSMNKYFKEHINNNCQTLFGLDKGQEASVISKKQTHNSTFRLSKKQEELSPEYLATKKKIQIILKRKQSGDMSS